MATGAKDWLNVHSLEPVKDRKIILYPDTSKNGETFAKWLQIANQYKAKVYNISVSTMLENECTQSQKEQGYDIGDLLHDNLIKEKPKEKQILLIEPQALTKNVSDKLKQMEQLNPALTELIKTFDLVVV